MKVYQTKEIRNVAIIGGNRVGKTTLAEAMAFHGGVISRRGTVEDKNTISDYRDIELERQQSIQSTVMYAEFEGCKINMIDCPGFDDFVGEVIGSLRVMDAALMVINAQNGVDVGAEIQWRWTKKMNVPVMFVVNELDHEKANFDETLRQLKHYFGGSVMPFQYPVNAGVGFDSVIDLLQMKLLKFPVGGGKMVVEDIPAGEKDKAEEMHNALIEAAAENDETLMDKFFEEGTLSEEEMIRGLKLGVLNRGTFPVFCVAAKTDQGVDRMMELVVKNCPTPDESPAMKATNGNEHKCNAAEPFAGYVFKTTIEQHIGEVAFIKVCDGEIVKAADLLNTTTNTKERISQLLVFAGKNRVEVEKAVAGDVVATIKMKSSPTGSTLVAKGDDIIEPTVYPEPKFRTAVRAKNTADEEKMGAALNEIRKTDPTFLMEQSKELKQMIISGQGEQHLNIVKWLVERSKIEIEYYAPKIPYRETITKSAEAMYRHKKQSGGSGQFGEVHMLIESYYEGMPTQQKYPIRATETYDLPWGGKLIYNNCIVGGAIDARFMPAILKGIMEKMEDGPLTGSYARDIVVNIYDGKMHPVDSNELAFKLAGRNAFKEAFKNAGPKILEPIYDVEVFVPADRMGDVMTDLQGRRGIVMGMDSEGEFQNLRAKVPLAEMNKYSTTLSSITSGRASYSMKFAEYQQVPAEVQSEIIKKYEEENKDEE
ncbi:MAG: elongation factor G [Bacteroidales bacterium]|nr:elongation factor G [Bacteroidales bacterium]MBQ7488937.1 elongation factor G [Bacteroidales bacterium]